jgi:pyrroline-5-carboxylate reductase
MVVKLAGMAVLVDIRQLAALLANARSLRELPAVVALAVQGVLATLESRFATGEDTVLALVAVVQRAFTLMQEEAEALVQPNGQGEFILALPPVEEEEVLQVE